MRRSEHNQAIKELRAAYANDLRTEREEHDREVDRLRKVYDSQISSLREQLETANETIQRLMERMVEKYMPLVQPFADNNGAQGTILLDPMGTGLITEFYLDEDEDSYAE